MVMLVNTYDSAVSEQSRAESRVHVTLSVQRGHANLLCISRSELIRE
jgi:hypothetical protein